MLTRVPSRSGVAYLRKDAAVHFLAANVRARSRGQGSILLNGPISGYRSYSGQVQMRVYWCGQGKCGNAAVPGTSNHGWGIAADSDDAWKLDDGGPFDKRYSDAPWESWHRRDGHVSQTEYVPPATAPTRKTLKSGDVHSDVRYLKKLLRDRGVKNAGKHPHKVFPPVDNGKRYGGNAVRRVRWFQQAMGMKVDGIVGEKTWAALKRKAKH
jgi:hypothetical protein